MRARGVDARQVGRDAGVALTKPPSSARLFFALWPDEAMQAALAAAVTVATGAAEATPWTGSTAGARDATGNEIGRPVLSKNFHLTLAFLGAVPVTRFEALSEVATQCAQAFDSSAMPIVVTLDTLEHWRKPQILCAAATHSPPAAVELAESLKRALIEQGFAPDLKPFRPHATVARKVRRVTGELHIQPVQWTFRDFHLIESQTGPADSSSYSTLKKWALDKCD